MHDGTSRGIVNKEFSGLRNGITQVSTRTPTRATNSNK